MVGAARFELATPCTPCRCATGLRYAPSRLFQDSIRHFEAQLTAAVVTVQSWWVELAEGGLPNAGAGGSGYVIYLGWMRKSTSALRTGMC